MKRLNLTLALLALACSTVLAGGSKWLTDLDQAKKIAAKQNKSILIDFTGSNWCGWCKVLEKEVFGQQKFVTEAGKHFVLVELDFPRPSKQSEETKKKNADLAKKFKVRAFPTVVLTDSGGKEFARTGYREGGVGPYLNHLKKLRDQKDMD